MPADASIYNLIRPAAQPEGPIDSYGKVLTLRNLMDQQGLQDLQRRKMEQEFADDDAFRGAARTAGSDLSKLRDLLYQGGNPTKALSVDRMITDRDKAGADLAGKRMETLAKATGILKDRLPTVRDDASYQMYRETALQLLGPDMVQKLNLPGGFDPSWVRNQMVKAEELFTPKPQEMDLGGKRVVVDMNPFTNPSIVGSKFDKTMTPGERDSSARGWAGLAETKAEHGRAQARHTETTQAGRWTNDLDRGVQGNTATGETRPIPQGGAPIGPKDKDPNDAQGKAILFGSRMTASDGILRGLEKKGVTTGSIIKQGAEALPLVGGAAGMATNWIASKDQQLVEQAQRDFINAVLRRESGAVISPQEFDNARKQYFGQPGDDPATLEQKQANRALAVKGMETEAGRHAPAIARNVAATRTPAAQTTSGTIAPAKVTQADIDAELRRRGVIK